MEIERKFLITQLPDDLDDYPFLTITQAYLCTNPVVRIRRQDDEYYLTYKGGGMMVREEYNLPLNKEAFAHLLAKADGNIISKKRYLIPISNPAFRDGYTNLTFLNRLLCPLFSPKWNFPTRKRPALLSRRHGFART